MKIILSAAISVNGYIADENGSEDFLSHENWIAFTKLAKKTGNFIYGRKTYEAVKSWEKDYLTDLKDVVKLVISANKKLKPEWDFQRVDSPEEAIALLRNKGYEEILVTGGSSIYSYFLSHNLIDEIIFYVNPVILGKGKLVFNFEGKELKLELLESTELNEGILELHYKVFKD